MDPRHSLRKYPILRPSEHQARNRKQHSWQIVDERDSRTCNDQSRPVRFKYIAQQARCGEILSLRALRYKLPWHRIVNRCSKHEVEETYHSNGNPNRHRQRTLGVPCLTTGLGNRIESDEARKKNR